MNSRFYYRMTYRGNGTTVPVTIDAPFVTNLSAKIRQVASLVVLADDEGNAAQGLHLWVQDRWRLALPQVDVSLGVVVGYDIDIYYELLNPMPVPEGTFVFRNGQRFTGTTMTADSQFIWVVMTPAAGSGTVKSVNNESPDANGNVQIDIADIPGLEQALEDAGKVKTVNNIQPDAAGNIQLSAADVGAVSLTVVGQPNGVPSLDSNGWVPMSQLPPGIIGGLQYQGTYDAATDTPPLPAPAQSNKGWYWVVSEAGTQQGLDLRIGDWVVSNGTSYDKIDNQEGRVLSVNGAMPDPGTGNVVVPFATATVAGTVYVPPSGGLLIGNDGALTVNTAQIGSWTPSDTVWVDYNGDAVEGTGKENNPYRTIGEAIDNAPANAVIMISPGSFAESLVLGSKPLYIKGWGNVGNYARTVITGNLTVGGTNQIRIQDLGINYNGTQPCMTINQVGTTAGFKFENISINANNTQTAILTNATGGAWTGSAYFVSLYVNAGKIDCAAGTGYVTVRMYPSDSTSVLEVHGGTVDVTEVWHLNSILHTAGTLQLFRARSIGTDPAVAALVSTADNSPGNFLLLHNVGTWINPTQQSFISKTGTCPYVIDNLTRNLANDVFNGTMVPLKTGQDQDIVVSHTGVNYTGARGAYLSAHLQGIDTALGARLSQIVSVGTGTTLVGTGTLGQVKSLAGGTGIQVTSTADTVTVTNTGVVALSTVTGAGNTSLVNTAAGQLKAIRGTGGMTITEAGGVITLDSSTASTGVTSLNGLVNAVSITASAPLGVVVNAQDIGLTYSGLRSLNGVVGAGQLLAGLGIDVDTTGQNLTVTNTGVHYLRAAGNDLTEGVTLVAGANVTLASDAGANTITINSTGGGGGGVTSVNTLQGALTIAGGSGIAISGAGSTITVTAVGASNPVASLNTLSGNLNLVGDQGVTVTAQGADTLLISYDGGASVSVTSLNDLTGALNIVAGDGITIDATTTPGSILITNTMSALQTVSNTTDGTAGSVGLVADPGTGGVATIKKLLPSNGVSFVETATGIQILVSGGSGGGGSVSSVAGIPPDGTGNVPLTGADLGALMADGTAPFTASQDAAGFTINNLADPAQPQQPVTLNYMSGLIIDQGAF